MCGFIKAISALSTEIFAENISVLGPCGRIMAIGHIILWRLPNTGGWQRF
jgi:hypothetical protein